MAGIVDSILLNIQATVSGATGVSQLSGNIGGLTARLVGLNSGLQVVQQVTAGVQQMVSQMGEYARKADAAAIAAKTWDTVLSRFNVNSREAQGVIDDLVARTGASEIALKGAAAQYIKMGGTLEDFQRGALAATSSWSDLTVKTITLEESISNVTLGLAMGRSEMMESSGIVVNASQAWDKWAEANDRTVKSMTDAEKAHAYATAVYKEEQIGIETLAEKQTELTRAETASARAKEEMGRTIGGVVLPAYTQMVRGSTGVMQTVTDLIRAYQQGGDASADFARKHPALARALDQLKPAADRMKGGLLDAWSGIKGAYDRVLVPIFERVGPVVQRAWAQVPGIVDSAGRLIGETFRLISDLWERVLRPTWDAIAPVVSAAFAGVAATLKGALDFVTGIFTAVRALIAGDWQGAWEAAKEAVGRALGGLEKLLSGILLSLNDVIDRAAQTLAEKAKTLGLNIKDSVVSGLAGLAGRLASEIGTALDQATSRMPDWAKRLLGITALQGVLAQAESVAGAAAEGANNSLTGRTNAATQAGVAAAGAELDPGSFNLAVWHRAFEKRGDKLADNFVDFCLRWVRDNLGDAAPEFRAQIDKLMQANPERFVGKDGKVSYVPTARSAYNNLENAGLTRKYKTFADLKPGDTVFYTDGGQNHAGTYIGDGLVRGNNRVSFRESGGKDPVGNVGINQLGRVTGYVSAAELMAYLQGQTPVTGTPKAGSNAKPPPSPGPTTPPPAAAPSAEDVRKSVEAKIHHILARVDLKLIAAPAAVKLIAGIRDEAEKTARSLEQKGAKGWQEYAASVKTAQGAIDGLKKGVGGTKDVLGALSTQFEYAGKTGLPAYVNGLRAFIREQEKVVAGTKKDSKDQLEAMANVKRARDLLEDATKPKGPVSVSDADMDRFRKSAEEVIRLEKGLETSKDPDWRRRAQNRIAAYNAQGEAAQGVLAVLQGVARREEELSDQSDQREKRQAQIRARVADERRQLTVSAAEGLLEELEELNRQELEGFRGTAAERQKIVEGQAKAEYDARVRVAAATRDKELRDSANADPKGTDPNRAERDRQIRERYTQAELRAQGQLEVARRGAVEGIQREADAVTGLTDKYRQAREALKKKADAGTLTAQDLTDYARTLGTYWQEAGRAGLKARPEIVAAHAAAKALAGTAPGLNAAAIEAQVLAGAFKDVAEGHTLAAQAAGNVQVSIEDAVANIPEGAEAAAAYVAVLKEMEGKGQLAAGSVKAVTDAIGEQADRLAAWEQQLAEAQAAIARRYGDGQTATDAAYRQSYGAGDEGLIRSLAATTGRTITQVRADVQGALDEVKEYAPQVAATIERVWDDALKHRREVAAEEVALSDQLIRDAQGSAQRIADAYQVEQDAADRTLITSKSLNGTLAELRAQGRDPVESGFVGWLEEVAQGSDEAAAAAQAMLDTFKEADLELARIAQRGADALFLAQNPGDVPDVAETVRQDPDGGFTFGDTSGFAQGMTDAFLGGTKGEQLRNAVSFMLSETFAQAGQEGRERFWDEFGSLTEDGSFAEIGTDLLEDLEASLRGNKAWEDIRKLFRTELDRRAEGGEASSSRGPSPEELKARADAWAQVMRAEAVDAYTLSLKKMDLAQLEAAQSQAILAKDAERYRLITAEIAVKTAASPEGVFKGMKEQAEGLQKALKSGEISLEDFSGQAGPLTVKMERLAAAAEANKNPQLAAYYRDLAAALRGLIPVVEQAESALDQVFGKLNEWTGYVQKLSGAFGGLADAMGAGDLAANLNGLSNAAGKAISIYADLKAVLANPGSPGAWVNLVAGVVGSIADAIGGFRKAKEELRKAKTEFEGGFKLVDASTFSSFTLRSRGFFADLFSGGPEVIKNIKESAADIARTIESGVFSGFSNGISNFLNGKGNLLTDIREALRSAIVSAITQAVIQGGIIKGALGPLLTDLTNQLADQQYGAARGTIESIGAALPKLTSELEGVLRPLQQSLNTALPQDQERASFGKGDGGTFQAGTPAVVVDVLGQARDLLKGANEASRLMVEAARSFGSHVDRFGQIIDRAGPHYSATASGR